MAGLNSGKLVALSGLFFLGSVYCLLALIQAGSLYTGARAEANLRFWGPLFCVLAAVSLLSMVLAFLRRKPA